MPAMDNEALISIVADRLWVVLTDRARRRQLITDTEAAAVLGLAVSGVQETTARISAYCREKGLPDLSRIVVNPATCRPSARTDSALTVEVEVLDVLAHYWDGVPQPSPAQIRSAWQRCCPGE